MKSSMKDNEMSVDVDELCADIEGLVTSSDLVGYFGLEDEESK